MLRQQRVWSAQRISATSERLENLVEVSRPPSAKAPWNSSMSTYAQIRLATEAYAVPVANVVEIASTGDLAAVPGARPEILGVRNLRGQILPVIDLAQLLGLNAPTPPKLLLVAESGSIQAGFAIDEVSHVRELPDPTEGSESDFLLGTMIYEGQLLAVIDVPRIFSALQAVEV